MKNKKKVRKASFKTKNEQKKRTKIKSNNLIIDIDYHKGSFIVRKQLIEFFWAVQCFLSALASLIHLVNDEASQKSVDGDGVDGNEQGGDSEADDEHDLNYNTSTTRR